MWYKNFLSISILFTMMLLTCSCAKDYMDEIAESDKNVVNLKQTDIELRALIETELLALNSKINAALSKSETEKRLAIKNKIEQWTTSMNEMIARMENLSNVKIQEKTQKLNAQLTSINAKIAAFEQHNTQQIAQLEQDIQNARNQADAATLAKLEVLKKRLVDADANMDALNQKMNSWQNKLNTIASKDYSVIYTKYKSRLQQLNNIDMETRYQNMQAMLKALTISEYESLTHNDLKTINGFITRINRIYNQVYKQYDNIDSNLKDWETRAEDECSALDNLTSDLEAIDLDGVEQVIDNYEGYDDKVNEVESWAQEFENFKADVEGVVNEVESKISEAEEAIEEIDSTIHGIDTNDEDLNAAEIINQWGEQLAEDMNSKLQDLSDRYPNAWGGTTPSVSW